MSVAPEGGDVRAGPWRVGAYRPRACVCGGQRGGARVATLVPPPIFPGSRSVSPVSRPPSPVSRLSRAPHAFPPPPHRRRPGRRAGGVAPAAQGGGLPCRDRAVADGGTRGAAHARVRRAAVGPELHARHDERARRARPPPAGRGERRHASDRGDDGVGEHRHGGRGDAARRARLHREAVGQRAAGGDRPQRGGARASAAPRPTARERELGAALAERAAPGTRRGIAGDAADPAADGARRARPMRTC